MSNFQIVLLLWGVWFLIGVVSIVIVHRLDPEDITLGDILWMVPICGFFGAFLLGFAWHEYIKYNPRAWENTRASWKVRTEKFAAPFRVVVIKKKDKVF